MQRNATYLTCNVCVSNKRRLPPCEKVFGSHMWCVTFISCLFVLHTVRLVFRRWLALNEIAEEGQKPIITIYDLTTYKRRKILTVPFENSTAREFACIQFTYDSKYLVAITGEPDWYLYYYNWDKGKVESHAKAQNPNGTGSVESVRQFITSYFWTHSRYNQRIITY